MEIIYISVYNVLMSWKEKSRKYLVAPNLFSMQRQINFLEISYLYNIFKKICRIL